MSYGNQFTVGPKYKMNSCKLIKASMILNHVLILDYIRKYSIVPALAYSLFVFVSFRRFDLCIEN